MYRSVRALAGTALALSAFTGSAAMAEPPSDRSSHGDRPSEAVRIDEDRDEQQGLAATAWSWARTRYRTPYEAEDQWRALGHDAPRAARR